MQIRSRICVTPDPKPGPFNNGFNDTLLPYTDKKELDEKLKRWSTRFSSDSLLPIQTFPTRQEVSSFLKKKKIAAPPEEIGFGTFLASVRTSLAQKEERKREEKRRKKRGRKMEARREAWKGRSWRHHQQRHHHQRYREQPRRDQSQHKQQQQLARKRKHVGQRSSNVKGTTCLEW